MLKRIKKIQNIGKFVDCSAGGCEFSAETVIFGYNTHGKSTLTAILRSIQTGKSDILIGRKSFGSTSAKKVEIDFENNGANDSYIYQAQSWNKSNPNILIFDSKFIGENIFEGERITFDQQKNLNTIIIGKKGQDLNNEIRAFQERSDQLAAQRGEKTREYSRHFPSLAYEQFKTIPNNDRIDDELSNKDKEIRFERAREGNKKAIITHLNTLSEIDFSIRDTLAKTLDVKQKEIEAHIKGHFTGSDNATTFLNEGMSFLKPKPMDGSKRKCVFCGQQLDERAEALIDLYSAFFKGGYEQLQKEIEDATESFKQLNIEAILGKILGDLKARELDVGINDNSVSEIVTLKKEFEKELDKKRDLNYSISFANFDRLKDQLGLIKRMFEQYEKEKLNATPAKTLKELINEKSELEIVKMRHDLKWSQFCESIKQNEAEAENVRVAREAKRQELEAYSVLIFNTHKGTINSFCMQMGADFKLEDMVPLRKLRGTDERVFAIKFFNSHKVNIYDAGENTPSFKNTLSESDKRLLAFAFFLSFLAHDRELSQRIILFDDPMSSFDRERRRKTLHLLADISCKYSENGNEQILRPKQKIILTHEEGFAKELKRLMPSATTLKISEEVVNGTKCSKITHADFSHEFPDDDISNRIEKVKMILDQRQLTEPFEEDCRIVLEHIFKKKYYLQLKDVIAQKKSVRSFVEKLKLDQVNGFDQQDKFTKFARLCNDLNIELHDNGASASGGDKASILNDFFDCLIAI